MTYLSYLIRTITEDLNKCEATSIVLFGVWHWGLLYELFHLQNHTSSAKLLRSYFSKRKIRKSMKASLLLEPLRMIYRKVQFFCLTYSVSFHNTPISNQTSVALFADETMIAAQSHNPALLSCRLQFVTDKFQKYCTAWKIQFNEKKSHAIHRRRCRLPPDTPIPIV